MRRFILLFVVVLIAADISSAQEPEASGGLNEIRFEGWGEKEWLDNDYIRELRNFFDAYASDDVSDDVKEQYSSLEPYKPLMDSQFTLLYIEPFLGGGAYMIITFLEDPRTIFAAWVYSYISDDGVTIGYDVRHCEPQAEPSELTREEILSYITENPLNKLW